MRPGRIGQCSRDNLAYWMELVLQRGHNAEVAASPANGPKKVRIGFLAGLQLSSVRSHYLRREQVVTSGAVLLHQAAFSAAEREAGNADRRAAAGRGGQSKTLRGFVQITHERASLGAGHGFAGVNFNSFHAGEVDDHSAVAHTIPETAMASSAHRQREVPGTGKLDGARDVGRGSTTHD